MWPVLSPVNGGVLIMVKGGDGLGPTSEDMGGRTPEAATGPMAGHGPRQGGSGAHCNGLGRDGGVGLGFGNRGA
jgi:hypothetical protein